VTDDLPAGLELVSAAGDGWACTGTDPIECTHAADLGAGESAGITVVTKITGTGAVTNVASMDVLGRTLQSHATLTPGSGFAFTGDEPGGFAFTGSEVARYGLMGLLLVVGGWFLIVAARKRGEDRVVES
jgi:hypothetical protein